MQYDSTSRFDTELIGKGTEGAVGTEVEPLDLTALLGYWEVYSRTRLWTSAHTVAEAIVAAYPERPAGWIYRSVALFEVGRVRESLAGLIRAKDRFPDDWRIPYNAACCCCQLGDVAGAWNWIDQSIELGNSDVIKSAALDDPNFQPLWARLGQV